MIRVLQINDGRMFGGIEKLELDYAKAISDDKFKIDILAVNENVFKGKNKYSNYEIDIYNLGIEKFNRITEYLYDYRLYRFLKNKNYDIVHINSKTFFYTFRVAIIAKLAGIKKVISHSHGYIKPNIIKRFFIRILNPMFRSKIDKFIATSEIAKESLLTKTYISRQPIKVLKNGIDIEKFKFNNSVRNELRIKLGLKNRNVYGYVARFVKDKNHEYILNLFNEIQKREKNSVLLLIGEGPYKDKIKERVVELKLRDKVVFGRFKDNIYDYYNAMDMFIFPSKTEGFGMVGIEAQTNGLITYCSDKIPDEVNISKYYRKFDLDENIEKIVDKIYDEDISFEDRKNAYKYTIKSGYDFKDTIDELREIYINLID